MKNLSNESIETLMETAAGVVAEITAVSTVFNQDHERRIPKFHEREVVVGKVVGRGGFCVVRNVEALRARTCGGDARSVASTASESSVSCLSWLCGSSKGVVVTMEASERVPTKILDDHDSASDERFSREYVAARSRERTRKGTRYVVKTVSTDLSKIMYMKGCADIAVETKFLSTLDHPNIITLVATSTAEPCSNGYFIVLERMSETLSRRIKKWMDVDRQNKSIIGALTGRKKKELKLYYEQIAASYDIANAFHYLHSRKIIFRDLKPDNVGFDIDNVLKLFDFGLSKELVDQDRREDGLYRNLTACTGAIRYMAPEVGLGRPYNLTADAYSWSMLMWFILALEPPFGLYSNEMIVDRVFRRGSRPALFKRWNKSISDVMKSCWDADIFQRPSFLEISLCLKQELIDSGPGSAVGDTTVSVISYHENGEGSNDSSGHD